MDLGDEVKVVSHIAISVARPTVIASRLAPTEACVHRKANVGASLLAMGLNHCPEMALSTNACASTTNCLRCSSLMKLSA
ncbi:hypothetical protein SAMN03159297_00857 [Pseudomonas sp. NFACC45]|nr:hypothetical protein SAMN03159297_00857 [Pseudomonas sp. NFACC45]